MRDDTIKGSLVLPVALFLLLVMTDCTLGHSESLHGVVHKMEHVQERVSRHLNSDGDWVTDRDEEKWIVYVRLDNGDYEDVNTKKKTWIRLKENDEIYVKARIGRFTGMKFFSSIAEIVPGNGGVPVVS